VVGAGPAGLAAAPPLAAPESYVLVVETARRDLAGSEFPGLTPGHGTPPHLGWSIGTAGAMRVRPLLSFPEPLPVRVREAVHFGYPSRGSGAPVSPSSPFYCPQDHLEPLLLGQPAFATVGRVPLHHRAHRAF